jgi:hypothetical protein
MTIDCKILIGFLSGTPISFVGASLNGARNCGLNQQIRITLQHTNHRALAWAAAGKLEGKRRDQSELTC